MLLRLMDGQAHAARLFGEVPDVVARWAGHTTQRLLRHHLAIESELDEITDRMDAAAQRRFPRLLQEAHLERVASGAIGKATRAWMPSGLGRSPGRRSESPTRHSAVNVLQSHVRFPTLPQCSPNCPSK